MIKVDLKATSLEDFYAQIRSEHEKAHGKSYVAVHDAIQKLVPNERYIELGINQGATLAGACLHNPKSVHAYDLNLSNFKPYKHHFEGLAFDFKAIEASSTDESIVHECDVLYIDTIHVWTYLSKELNLWSPYVTKYIACHDTHAKQDMRKGIDNWLTKNTDWELIEHNTQSVGYSVIGRK
jgi:hypothetical protein